MTDLKVTIGPSPDRDCEHLFMMQAWTEDGFEFTHPALFESEEKAIDALFNGWYSRVTYGSPAYERLGEEEAYARREREDG